MSALEWPTPAASKADTDWAEIAAAAPQLAVTMGRYLDQIATVLAATSVDVADNTLRQLARFLLDRTDVRAVVQVRRPHVEDFKVWLSQRRGVKGTPLAANTRRQRLQTLRMFFERIIEWEWPDAPPRNPVIAGDIPPSPEPLPRFLDDRDAAKVVASGRASTDHRDRVVVELLARTALRAGELCDLDADAVVLIGAHHWLRIPLGKLRNDRYVPLHPELVAVLATWCGDNIEHIRAHRRLIADHRGPLNRHAVGRIVKRVGGRVGVSVHPHQLRHTLATQAINRGMPLEAIAALLGHRSLHMTLHYARIADRVVADHYDTVSAQVDALYNNSVSADVETAAMAKLRRQAHARMLGNGLCTRPVELDCRMESACETCTYFQTGPEFVPVLLRQRDHAKDHGQTDRAALYDELIQRVAKEGA